MGLARLHPGRVDLNLPLVGRPSRARTARPRPHPHHLPGILGECPTRLRRALRRRRPHPAGGLCARRGSHAGRRIRRAAARHTVNRGAGASVAGTPVPRPFSRQPTLARSRDGRRENPTRPCHAHAWAGFPATRPRLAVLGLVEGPPLPPRAPVFYQCGPRARSHSDDVKVVQKGQKVVGRVQTACGSGEGVVLA